jgi:hypothetical protein
MAFEDPGPATRILLKYCERKLWVNGEFDGYLGFEALLEVSAHKEYCEISNIRVDAHVFPKRC